MFLGQVVKRVGGNTASNKKDKTRRSLQEDLVKEKKGLFHNEGQKRQCIERIFVQPIFSFLLLNDHVAKEAV
jgi:hypothetical protein